MKDNLNLFKYSLYLLLHKKLFIYLTVGLTLLLCAQSFQSIMRAKDIFYLGNASIHNFLMTTEYNRKLVLLALIYILPLFTMLSLSDTWYTESKFASRLFTKCSLKRFVIIKAVSTFIAGFLICFIPMIVNYLCEYIILGESNNAIYSILSIAPDNNVSFLTSLFPLYEIYLKNHTVFICIYIVMISVFGGLYSTTAFCISLLAKNKIISYLGCFGFTMIPLLAANILPSPFNNYYIQSILNPYSTMTGNLALVVSGYVVIFLLFIVIVIYVYMKKNRGGILE